MRDSAQEALVSRFERLQRELVAADASRGRLLPRILNRRPPPVRGLYVWGGVGRGKTFLMDLFFETLELADKKRIHFHRMMRDVHERLGRYGDVADPLDRVAAEIAADTRVLCFDEFFVSDIGDAMILGRLLRGLFDRRVTLVATSNVEPAELYRDGLQRDRFLPAIDLLRQHTEIVELDGATDYRLRLLEHAGTYLCPDDDAARRSLRRLFEESATTEIEAGQRLLVNGRHITAHLAAKGIAWFEFGEICDGPRSQADYIELARWYPTVIVSGVPVFDRRDDDRARRFIALVDEFYDRRVKLILSAAAAPADLYAADRLAFEFERTSSRLIEMQSREYLHQPHLA